ncbi:MAG: EamA family transporter, partial [Acidimicrobiales bacterium]
MWLQRIPWPVQFVTLAIVWGCSFWWMALGLRALQPAQVAAGRLILGALVLLAVCAFGRIPLPRERRTWIHLVVIAALLNSVPFTLFAFGQQRVTSSLAGVVHACTPLAVLAVTLVAFPEDRPTRERIVGLGVGFVGVLVVLGVWRSLPRGELVGIGACLAAISCYGIAFPYA